MRKEQLVGHDVRHFVPGALGKYRAHQNLKRVRMAGIEMGDLPLAHPVVLFETVQDRRPGKRGPTYFPVSDRAAQRAAGDYSAKIRPMPEAARSSSSLILR